MRTVGKTLDRDRLLEDAREMLAGTHDIEQVLLFIRSGGFGMLDSIKAIMVLSGVSLGEAKRLVHTSPVWADRRAEHDALHRALDAVAQADADHRADRDPID